MRLDLRNLLRPTAFIDGVPDLGGGTIDTDREQCTITIAGAGIEVYIGPKDPYAGGSAITIVLDHAGNYVSHALEDLEPDPEYDAP